MTFLSEKILARHRKRHTSQNTVSQMPAGPLKREGGQGTDQGLTAHALEAQLMTSLTTLHALTHSHGR